MPQDPYAAIAKPVADPYADLAGGTPPASTGAKPPTGNFFVGPDDRSALQHMAEDENPYKLDSYPHATLHGLYNIGQGVAQGVQGGWNLLKTAAKAWNDPHADVGDALMPAPPVGQVPGAIKDINQSPDPLGTYAKVASDTAGQGAGQISGGLLGEEAAGALPKILQRALATKSEATAPANLVRDTYSPAGDHISSALRSNTKVDVPAEAKIAAPAIEEGLNDRGINTKSFKGRNGPAALQAGIDNALDIHEARAKAMIDPIRGEAVDPQVLAKNPELTARFLDKEGNLPSKGITYGDLDAERIKMNKELRMGNFYSKPPSAQYAIQDPMASVHQAADQARNLVYDKVSQTTGMDISPVKRTESALIKLGDLAETTKNTLSPKEAQFNSTSLPKKIQGSVQGALSVKANPVNAFSIPEKTGLFNPLNEFNSHMRKAFPNLKAATADRTVSFPKYNLQLTSPAGKLPGPIQQMLGLSGGETIPGEDLKLTHPGSMPADAQRPLSFTENPNTNQSGPVAPGGTGTAPAPKAGPTPPPDLTLTHPGSMPPPVQQILDLSNATPATGVPRSLGAAAAAPATEEMPSMLREAVGLDRRATPRHAPLSATELEEAIKNRKPIQTPFDVTEGAMDVVNRDPAMRRIADEMFGGKQGGHAGGGVSSVEELSRSGKNYVVSKQGKLTYHGKSFAPEETPTGGAHVTVLPDGKLRVNAGDLTPAMEEALKKAVRH